MKLETFFRGSCKVPDLLLYKCNNSVPFSPAHNCSWKQPQSKIQLIVNVRIVQKYHHEIHQKLVKKSAILKLDTENGIVEGIKEGSELGFDDGSKDGMDDGVLVGLWWVIISRNVDLLYSYK